MISARRCSAALASALLLGLGVVNSAALVHNIAVGAPAHAVKQTTARATTTSSTPTLASRLNAVKNAKTLNYYPSTAGWSKMWTSWDAATIDADLARAASLGANNIRVIVFPTTFGWPTPSPTYVNRLDQFVDMAGARGMSVKLTLFDWWDGYTETDRSIAWAKTLLAPYKNDNRVLSVELQNEFNPDNATAVAWAKKIVPAVRAAFPTMPLTFSVDGGQGAQGMGKLKSLLAATPLDYYDFHFYGNSERALAMINQAEATVAPAPMVIGETGLSTLSSTEGEQAAFLGRVFEAAEIAGVPVAPWTLSDFASGAIPTSQVAKLPAQYNFGLYRLNGTAKPAAAVVKAGWANTAMPSSLMDPSFEAAAGQTPWRAYLPELGLATKTQAVRRTGSWSVTMSNTGKTSAGSPSYRVSPITPVKGGQKWHAEVWARGNATTGTTQIALSWFDINDKWLGGVSSNWLPNGTVGWTKLAVDGIAPAGAASMQVHIKSGENKGTVWFDDAVIVAS
ncbi:cellulase family glycosylhydrolase [Paractinoplanes deccanensis]|uniref:cellulase family glycosylhydrolase n=1 Tax=Paractinoplanes deccanensis TaxID=113561 RepID=UPI001940DC36|nr:cellulase family glycosylhydrolase [Actinoplanes deccanensis]